MSQNVFTDILTWLVDVMYQIMLGIDKMVLIEFDNGVKLTFLGIFMGGLFMMFISRIISMITGKGGEVENPNKETGKRRPSAKVKR